MWSRDSFPIGAVGVKETPGTVEKARRRVGHAGADLRG